jgi:hypothetical protein
MSRTGLLGLAVLVSAALPAAAQDDRHAYAGALFGVSTLSADGTSVTTTQDAALSLYKPENGLALNAFAGLHAAEYFSVQANYMWNRNDLTLVSSFVTPQGGGFYDQRRRSAQHAFVVDGLIYFRARRSAVRPYLGTGLSIVRFSSRTIVSSMTSQFIEPPAEIVSTGIALRSHVGIDIALGRRLMFRYSFSETIGRNPISRRLSPPGRRGLANFQNLFGVIWRL